MYLPSCISPCRLAMHRAAVLAAATLAAVRPGMELLIMQGERRAIPRPGIPVQEGIQLRTAEWGKAARTAMTGKTAWLEMAVQELRLKEKAVKWPEIWPTMQKPDDYRIRGSGSSFRRPVCILRHMAVETGEEAH